MSLLSKLKSAWHTDALLRRVVKSSAYLASGNTIAAGLSFIQGIIIARVLGAEKLGEVTTIIAFVTAINNLLSFRMSEVLVRHFNAEMTAGRRAAASAIAKGAGLIEAATSIIAYLVLLLLAPWAANLVKIPGSAPLFAYYGIILLSNIIFETSRGILQAHQRFGQFAIINLIQNILTFGLVIYAALTQTASVHFILTAYIAGKTLAGIAIIILAARTLNENLPGWRRVSLGAYTNWRGLFGFALNTNLNGTVNQFVRDNIPIYIAWLASTTDVGYFKVAFGFTNLLMLPIEPFIWPTYNEITRTIAAKLFADTRRLLRRVSQISAGWVAAAGGGIVLLGGWIIPLLYGAEYAPAYPAAILLIIGYGTANIFGWNRPLLLALGKPSFPLIVAAAIGAIELLLIFSIVPIYGYLSAAAIMAAYLLISVAIIVWRGLTEMRKQEAAT